MSLHTSLGSCLVAKPPEGKSRRGMNTREGAWGRSSGCQQQRLPSSCSPEASPPPLPRGKCRGEGHGRQEVGLPQQALSLHGGSGELAISVFLESPECPGAASQWGVRHRGGGGGLERKPPACAPGGASVSCRPSLPPHPHLPWDPWSETSPPARFPFPGRRGQATGPRQLCPASSPRGNRPLHSTLEGDI